MTRESRLFAIGGINRDRIYVPETFLLTDKLECSC
jgi:hypothetical protein